MNRLASLVACAFVVALAYASLVFGDGGFLQEVGSSADLAQTRQEAVLAFDGQEVTYVLRTLYTGSPNDFAWVMPVPATPTDVIAHPNSALFAALDDATRPRFMSVSFAGGGCGCSGPMAGGSSGTSLVTVEASGAAGVFNWAALTSSGAGALLAWLNQNGYGVPASAQGILDTYIQQEMHFLAVRIARPLDLPVDPNDPIEVPPLQFTCQTTRRYYPMIISKISAANETEVLVYLIAEHRVEAANVANGEIASGSVARDPNSASGTNYEALFAARIAALGGLALITEFAAPPDELAYYYNPSYRFDGTGGDVAGAWPNMPQGLRDPNRGFKQGLFLTRMRSVVPRDRMEVDFEFRDAAKDMIVSSEFWVPDANATNTASVFGRPVAALLIYGLFRAAARRGRRRRLYAAE